MKNTIGFLKKLKKNNNTPWMHAHKEEYLGAKKEFEFLVQELIFRIGEWDSRLSHLEPKQCIFRLNRDVRFSDNKKPYKENFGAFMAYGGKKSGLPGYYLNIDPTNFFVAGGIWMPEADKLLKIRRYILEHGDELEKILKDKKFKKLFGSLSTEASLKRAPKGFPADHPYGEFLKLKSFTVSSPLTLKDITAPGLGKKLDPYFKAMKPLNDFLYEAQK